MLMDVDECWSFNVCCWMWKLCMSARDILRSWMLYVDHWMDLYHRIVAEQPVSGWRNDFPNENFRILDSTLVPNRWPHRTTVASCTLGGASSATCTSWENWPQMGGFWSIPIPCLGIFLDMLVFLDHFLADSAMKGGLSSRSRGYR